VIVCHCTGITDRDIRSLVREGRASTVLEIGCDGSAGAGCGGCRLAIAQIVQIARQEELSGRKAVLTELVPVL
jgi:bacterioferritin-associated ferredoxin